MQPAALRIPPPFRPLCELMVTGLQRFARYAAPPNALHYCGPDDEIGLALAEHADSDDLRTLALQFDGAWPYLELIAACLGLDDPLDDRVVAAYWEGSPQISDVAGDVLDSMTRQVHGPRAASEEPLAAAARYAVPHHSYHVYCVYPWVGLLRRGITEPSVRVIDHCRISIGTVTSIDPLLVRRRPLAAERGILRESEPVISPVLASTDPTVEPHVGAIVSLHWDWICAVVDRTTADTIVSLDTRHRELANHVTELAASQSTTA